MSSDGNYRGVQCPLMVTMGCSMSSDGNYGGIQCPLMVTMGVFNVV